MVEFGEILDSISAVVVRDTDEKIVLSGNEVLSTSIHSTILDYLRDACTDENEPGTVDPYCYFHAHKRWLEGVLRGRTARRLGLEY
jgi:hypothetical protein